MASAALWFDVEVEDEAANASLALNINAKCHSSRELDGKGIHSGVASYISSWIAIEK